MPKSFARRIRGRSSVETAIVFVHGFSGDAEKTWGRFPEFLCASPRLKGWDVWSIGFDTSLYPEVRGVWSADPGLELLALQLRTCGSHGDLGQYVRLVLVAHSMGGLVVQRAIVDDSALAGRVDSLFLFGVPSLGLVKARLFRLLKLQVRDMTRDSAFIKDLRRRWSDAFPEHPERFPVHAVAGARDEFVPTSSSLEAFPKAKHYAVPGGHVSMVKPESDADDCVKFLINGICRDPVGKTGWTSEQAAIERGKFAQAIQRLLPNASKLTPAALVDLALALDAAGRRKDAIRVLEERPEKSLSSDALGVLGGRYKREWLMQGTESDVLRSYELYSRALEASESRNDHAQVFYHSINLAFLELVHFGRRGACKRFAEAALAACERAKSKDFWNLATKGEAHLYLSDAAQAVRAYRDAMRRKPSPSHVESAQNQAMVAAERALGERPAALVRVFERADS